ncbi:MAG: 50S ribosomal protein L11 methyltransferase [Alphaproteobacteria bacterium]|jgi:ribosomal protein L11 methyltransferase|nr:50S ribosomal protein L11 methyltransferase [Alphaproteobacteria bacterium]
MTSYYKVTLEGDLDALSEVETLWEEIALSTSLFEANPEGTRWSLEALFLEEPGTGTLFKGFTPALVPLQETLTREFLPARDWLAENRKTFAPLEIGSFFIHSADDRDLRPAGKRALEIEAATAFGTGRHETTKGCLELLEYLKGKKADPARILDLGCGTGILAMAAATLFQDADVRASDNDPDATQMTTHNLDLNQLGQRVEVLLSQGFESFLEGEAYDLIVANILAEPLRLLAPDMARFTSKDARLILSGLLTLQVPEIEAVYKQNGFTLEKAQDAGGWSAILLVKQP